MGWLSGIFTSSTDISPCPFSDWTWILWGHCFPATLSMWSPLLSYAPWTAGSMHDKHCGCPVIIAFVSFSPSWTLLSSFDTHDIWLHQRPVILVVVTLGPRGKAHILLVASKATGDSLHSTRAQSMSFMSPTDTGLASLSTFPGHLFPSVILRILAPGSLFSL